MAIVWGLLAFAVGFVGPMMFSESNLGPLFGLITGPLGALVGALFGIVRSARKAEARSLRPELIWLGAIWMVTLLLAALVTSVAAVVWVVVPPALVLIALACLLWNGKTRHKLPVLWRRCGPVVLAAGVVILLVTVVAPITQYPGQSARDQARTKAAFPDGIPSRALLSNPHLSASRQVPDFAVDLGQLLGEWLAISGIAAGACAMVARR